MRFESATLSANKQIMRKCVIPLVIVLGVVLAWARPAPAQVFQELYSFGANGDGLDPEGALVQGSDGSFYGTTMEGPYLGGYGTVFKLTLSGQLTTLASFDGTNGCWPSGALVQASDGNFYGTTYYGGGADDGTIFRITPEGTLTTLIEFGVAHPGLPVPGAYPIGDLTEGPDRKLYGVTQAGTVFRMALDGAFEDLGGPGGEPSGGLLLASDGNFYGVTSSGSGTVYRLSPDGSFTNLAEFSGCFHCAEWPNGKMLDAPDGSFFGASDSSDHIGAVFRVTTNGTLTSFYLGVAGDSPVGPLVLANDGNIYGASTYGGWNYGFGSIFEMTLNGDPRPLILFEDVSGRYPYAGLVLGTDGNLYGTTGIAGSRGGGNVFRVILPGNECRLSCPTNITVCNDAGQCGAMVDFGPPVTTNCDGYVITCTPPSGSFFSVGTNTVLCTAVDQASQPLTNTCSFEVIVHDCEPPVIHSVTATPASLWPPNHKMQPVTLSVNATDNCHVARSKIISVTSTEVLASAGVASPDWQITGDLTVNLRAERSGNGPGRIYTITVECADDAGNTSTAQAQVTVPH